VTIYSLLYDILFVRIRMSRILGFSGFLSESGYPGFQDLQDLQDFL
jgi:hypothetical protein